MRVTNKSEVELFCPFRRVTSHSGHALPPLHHPSTPAQQYTTRHHHLGIRQQLTLQLVLFGLCHIHHRSLSCRVSYIIRLESLIQLRLYRPTRLTRLSLVQPRSASSPLDHLRVSLFESIERRALRNIRTHSLLHYILDSTGWLAIETGRPSYPNNHVVRSRSWVSRPPRTTTRQPRATTRLITDRLYSQPLRHHATRQARSVVRLDHHRSTCSQDAKQTGHLVW